MLPFDRWERELTIMKRVYDDPPASIPPLGTERLLGEILEAYASADDDEERRRIRELVPKYEFVFLHTLPPEPSDPIAALRLRLLLFSVKDQYPDYREIFTEIDEIVSLCKRLGVSEGEFARLRLEVAELSNPEPRWPGFFPVSTREVLRKGAGGTMDT